MKDKKNKLRVLTFEKETQAVKENETENRENENVRENRVTGLCYWKWI